MIIRVLSEDDSILSMVDSNLRRERISYSEKAFAYKLKNEVLKRKSGRKKSQVDHKTPRKRAIEIISEDCGNSPKQVQRYISLTKLIPEMLQKLDDEIISFCPAVEIAALNEKEQKELLVAMEYAQAIPSLSQAQRIRQLSKEKQLSLEKMEEIMCELDDETGIGLIEKRRQGFGKVNVIYVKTFVPEKTDEKKFGEELEKFKKQTSVENEDSIEVYNSNFMKSQNQTSRSPENKLQEVYISNPNNTNLSDTEMNDNKSNHIISVDEKRFDSDSRSEDYQAYENLVKETIDYESLEVTHHDDMRQVDEIMNLIVETVMCKNDKILIASNWYPASLVKKKFLMLTYSHIEYVLHCMRGNTTKVKNIKKYLLAALFNAPSTMNGYYQAEVNHDMPGLVR